jgi:hypothetical protein
VKYAVETVSAAMIGIPSFIKIGSAIQKLIGEIHRRHGNRISLLSFLFKIWKVWLKKPESHPPSVEVIKMLKARPPPPPTPPFVAMALDAAHWMS